MNGNPDRGHPSVTGTTPGWQVGFGPLLRAVEDAKERQRKVMEKARNRAAEYEDPGRPVDVHLLDHEIPPHVADAIATPTQWGPDGEQDQRLLHRRIKTRVARSLVLRGFGAEEFLAMLPTYTPPPGPDGRGRRNILWEELTTRGRRQRGPEQYEPIVTLAFKYATEDITHGRIEDEDQPDYITAVVGRWRDWIATRRVRLTDNETLAVNYVLHQMSARGFVNVACPSRQLADVMGVWDPKTAWRVLKTLTAAGVLICRKRGVGGWESGEAAVYCLSPAIPPKREQTPKGVRSKHQGPERPEPLDKGTFHGTATTLNRVNPQVKGHFPEVAKVPHTKTPNNYLTTGVPPAFPGSIGMWHPAALAPDPAARGIEGVLVVRTGTLAGFRQLLTTHPPGAIEAIKAIETIEAVRASSATEAIRATTARWAEKTVKAVEAARTDETARAIRAVEDYYAGLSSAWGVLWTGLRCPLAPRVLSIADRLVVFEAERVALRWMNDILPVPRAGEEPWPDWRGDMAVWWLSRAESRGRRGP
jgi:hypothetical protein